MKIILIFLLLVISLLAKDDKSCYTVQLLSVKNSNKNMHTISKKRYPSSCKVMRLKSSIAVRCGCFEKIEDAEDRLYSLEDDYTDASITTTYKRRFKKNKRINKSKKKKKTKKNKTQESCHSVEIFKKRDTKKTREILSQMNFPNNCQKMTIGKSLAVRCGCYKTKKEARVESYILEDDYKNVSLKITYKYKFKEKFHNSYKQIKEQRKINKNNQTKTTLSNKTCYSVEIFREKNTQENMGKLLMQEYPDSCINVEIQNMLSIRCGCYQNKNKVLARYYQLKDKFKDARISKTYVRRF